MLFNSPVFLLLFLPCTLFVYWFLVSIRRQDASLAWLIVASLFYYAFYYLQVDQWYVGVFVTSIVTNYWLGRCIGRVTTRRWRRGFLIAGLTLNLSLLAYFKYAQMLFTTFSDLLQVQMAVESVAIPLAISFFTFQQIAYLVDVYQDHKCEHDFLSYCLFVTFFPQLIAGPIVHHKEMLPQFSTQRRNGWLPREFDMAVGCFVIGLFKKVVVADTLAFYVGPLFASAAAGEELGFFAAWTAALAYTFQLYFDFSGYSDMAIGLGLAFGIKLPVNFDSPYQATSIVEFWRRWHITLSGFLRDYLYIPLGGSRHGVVRRYFNLFTTMFLGGLWHGADWAFAMWGTLHGVYLAINHAWAPIALRAFRDSLNLGNMQSSADC